MSTINNQAALIKQLEQKTAFYLPAPGFNLDQVDTFFQSLQKIFFDGQDTDLSGLIPEHLSVLKEINIQSLSFTPPANGQPFYLDFTLAMESANWVVIPNLLMVENIQVKVDISDPVVTANLYGIIAIKDLIFGVAVELPSGYLSALLQTKSPSAQAAFEHFQLPHIGEADKYPTLDAFKILVAPRAHQASFNMSMSNIQLGPINMGMQLALDYAGRPKGHLSGLFWGYFIIQRHDAKDNIDLVVKAQHNDPDSGWQFDGQVVIVQKGFPLTEFVEKNIKLFAPNLSSFLPDVLNDVELDLKSVGLSFNSKTKDFQFSCELDTTNLFGEGVDVDFFLTFDLSRSDTGTIPHYEYELTFDGRMVFKTGKAPNQQNFEFDLAFSTEAGQKTFVATYQSLCNHKIAISNLIKAFDKKSEIPNIPMEVELKDVFFAFTKKKSLSKFLFGVDIDSGINLASLPLIGNILKVGGGLKLSLQPIAASRAFTAAELQEIVHLAPGGKISLPNKDLAKGVDLACHLQIGHLHLPLDLPVEMANGNNGVKTKPTPPKSESATPGSNAVAPNSAGDIHWFSIQKGFGPVYFNRIGVQFKKSTSQFWFLLDTDLAAGPLTLSLDGLGVGSKLQPIKPHFTLHGLGLDYQSGPLAIGGNFLRTEVKDYYEYDGMAVLKMEVLSISALGSYARVNGETSLFIYATLNYPLGGPSFFFVEGLALGFGYNRQLKMPPIGDVATFPLVSAAMGGGSLPGDYKSRAAYLQDQLSQLRQYIPPHQGEYFLAVGIHFSSFELLDSFVLVSVSFGEHFEVDILGISRLVIPSPQASGAVTPLAIAELALKAAFDPERGFLGVQAQLTSHSYILSQQCHLTGGFAFYTWFKDDTLTPAKAGDFVLSLGGYHPAFKVPSYYPRVPRLGFNWQISDELSFKGGLYFALTPKVLMAGGSLEANFDNGHVRAWFDASANFIVYWKPYHYDAKFHIDVGGKVWIIKFDAGADVHLWGPDFAGVATIDCCAVSFTVHFGDSSPTARPISWEDFHTSFLPNKEKVCTIAVEGGLVSKKDINSIDHYIINPKEFSLTTNSIIPNSSAILNKTTTHKGNSFGIAPMNLGNGKASSAMTLDIQYQKKPFNYKFKSEAINKNLPVALWGNQFRPDLNGKTLVEDMLAGLRILPAKPPTPGSTQAIEKSAFKYSINFIDQAFAFEKVLTFQYDKKTAEEDRAELSESITKKPVSQARDTILKALGLGAEIQQIRLSPELADDFVEAPLVGTFSFKS